MQVSYNTNKTKSSEALEDVQLVHIIKKRNAENQNYEFDSPADLRESDYKETLTGKHTFKSQ